MVDEDTGDFCSINPTTCPQCKRCDAFVDSSLPLLSSEVCQREVEEVQKRRSSIQHRHREQCMHRLESETRSIPRRIVNCQGFVDNSSSSLSSGQEECCIRQLSGYAHHVTSIHSPAYHSNYGTTLEFAEYSTVGIPSLYTSSGVFYYEVRVVSPHLVAPRLLGNDYKCGFALLDGVELSNTHTGIGVGETCKSWGFDSLGNKLNGVVFSDQRYVPHWYSGCVMGFAVNIDKGMIACSVDGKWDVIEKCGVKFEDEMIKLGVYPCISGRGVVLQVRYRADSWQYAPPPQDLWDCWPKYQDLSWITMPAEARTAAMVMGYTSTTWAWSGNPIDTKPWDDMTPEEQAAGNVLGYNKKIWTELTTLWARDAQDNPDSDSEGDISFSCFSAMFWNDLPEDARRAAETLGYSKTAWDEDSRIPLGVKWFSQLTQEQRKAAIVLGYDSQSWNEHTESNLTSSVASDASFVLPFDHLQWDALPPNARDAAEVLGYTKEGWDGNDCGPLEYEPWSELTVVEQEAATVLGYDETTWDEFL